MEGQWRGDVSRGMRRLQLLHTGPFSPPRGPQASRDWPEATMGWGRPQVSPPSGLPSPPAGGRGSGLRAGALPVKQRGVDVQVLHGHPNAPVCVAGGRHGARRAAAQVAQVGELVVGNGGQGAADRLPAHGRARRGRSGRGPALGVPAASAASGALRPRSRAGTRPRCQRLGHEAAHCPHDPSQPLLRWSGSGLSWGPGSTVRRLRVEEELPRPTRPSQARQPAEPGGPSSSLPELLGRRQRRALRRGEGPRLGPGIPAALRGPHALGDTRRGAGAGLGRAREPGTLSSFPRNSQVWKSFL